MLEELKQNYVEAARGIPWETINKNDLFNLYLQNENDEELRNKYVAAIICRYWYLIFTNYEKSKGSVDIYTCYEWVSHAVLSVLKRRAWTKEDSSVYGDPNGPDKCLNQSVCSHRKGFYQSSNTDKKRSNFKTISSEDLYDSFGESSKALVDEETSYTEDTHDVETLVQHLIENERYLEALVIDNIAYGECFKEKYSKGTSAIYKTDEDGNEVTEEFTYDKVNRKFSQRMLNLSLKELDDSYPEYFSSRYLTDKDCILNCISRIKGMTTSQLNKLVKNTLFKLSQDADILSYLM